MKTEKITIRNERYFMKYTKRTIQEELKFWKDQMNEYDDQMIQEAKDVEKENENPNYFRSVQKTLNKLISEEWMCGNAYLMFLNAVDKDDFLKIREAFLDAGNDEIYDHMKSLIEVANKYGYDVPVSYKEFSKYANKEEVKMFESIKKNQDALFYLKQGLDSEERAIKAYEEAMNDDNIVGLPELQIILKNNYYDEKEHYETFKFLIYSIESNMDFRSMI